MVPGNFDGNIDIVFIFLRLVDYVTILHGLVLIFGKRETSV